MSTINREAYEHLIAEDLAALAMLPDSLERHHIEMVLHWSISALYPKKVASTDELARMEADFRRSAAELLQKADYWKERIQHVLELPSARAEKVVPDDVAL